jgi:hypothetical protein
LGKISRRIRAVALSKYSVGKYMILGYNPSFLFLQVPPILANVFGVNALELFVVVLLLLLALLMTNRFRSTEIMLLLLLMKRFRLMQ